MIVRGQNFKIWPVPVFFFFFNAEIFSDFCFKNNSTENIHRISISPGMIFKYFQSKCVNK